MASEETEAEMIHLSLFFEAPYSGVLKQTQAPNLDGGWPTKPSHKNTVDKRIWPNVGFLFGQAYN